MCHTRGGRRSAVHRASRHRGRSLLLACARQRPGTSEDRGAGASSQYQAPPAWRQALHEFRAKGALPPSAAVATAGVVAAITPTGAAAVPILTAAVVAMVAAVVTAVTASA